MVKTIKNKKNVKKRKTQKGGVFRRLIQGLKGAIEGGAKGLLTDPPQPNKDIVISGGELKDIINKKYNTDGQNGGKKNKRKSRKSRKSRRNKRKYN